MELIEKLQSTKLGMAGATIAVLFQVKADPWCIVAVAAAYMVSNAIQKIKGA